MATIQPPIPPQQIGLVAGVVTSALVIGFTISFLNPRQGDDRRPRLSAIAMEILGLPSLPIAWGGSSVEG